MFAALYSVSAPVDTLVRVAQSFSPRVEVSGRLVLCDLARRGAPVRRRPRRRRAHPPGAGGCRRRASGAWRPRTRPRRCWRWDGRASAWRPRPTEARAALAPLPVATLAAWDSGRAARPTARPARRRHVPSGWVHPRDTHQGPQTRRQVRGRVQMTRGSRARRRRRAHDAPRRRSTCCAAGASARWGSCAALPAAELSARLGPLGPRWQHAARGDDLAPLVPLVDDEPFEASLELEWPVEGLEPLSFVLGRVLEPLAVRLERADRGAAVLHTELHLTTRELAHAHAAAAGADARSEDAAHAHPARSRIASARRAAIDRVVVRVEPTPGRIVQWSLLERAQPSPEQVSTLLARLERAHGRIARRLARAGGLLAPGRVRDAAPFGRGARGSGLGAREWSRR